MTTMKAHAGPMHLSQQESSRRPTRTRMLNPVLQPLLPRQISCAWHAVVLHGLSHPPHRASSVPATAQRSPASQAYDVLSIPFESTEHSESPAQSERASPEPADARDTLSTHTALALRSDSTLPVTVDSQPVASMQLATSRSSLAKLSTESPPGPAQRDQTRWLLAAADAPLVVQAQPSTASGEQRMPPRGPWPSLPAPSVWRPPYASQVVSSGRTATAALLPRLLLIVSHAAGAQCTPVPPDVRASLSVLGATP